MTGSSIIIGVVAILAVSTAFSMVGLGGGVLYVPILLALGMGIHDAAATSLFVIVAMAVTAVIVYRRSSNIDWKLMLLIEPPTAALALVGGYLAKYIDAPVLATVFAIVLVVSGIVLLKPAGQGTGGLSNGWGRWKRNVAGREYAVYLPGLMPVTSVAGFLSGLIGISGGILKMPAMVLIGRVPMRIAIGTSSLMVGITAAFGFSGHVIGDSFDIITALPLAAAAFLGGLLGSSLSARVRIPVLRLFVAVVLLLVAAWMIVDTYFI